MVRTLLTGIAISLSLSTSAFALTAQDIESASFTGDAVPDGQSGLVVKLQVLLDRAGISPGVIDGYKGGMSESALRAYELRQGFDVDGLLDAQVWSALGGDGAAAPITYTYTITEEDASGLTDSIPDHVADKAEMDHLGYTSVREKLAERFHMDQDFLTELNPGSAFAAGDAITVVDTGAPLEAEIARVEIRKGSRRAVTFDASDVMIASYPVTIGSDNTPSPHGDMQVVAVAYDPTYTYNPDVNFEADGVKEALILPPGPNGPVGTIWIDLSEPTYGLHGTDTPAKLFTNSSHGCVRFTNWDVEELADMVSEGTAVSFVE